MTTPSILQPRPNFFFSFYTPISPKVYVYKFLPACLYSARVRKFSLTFHIPSPPKTIVFSFKDSMIMIFSMLPAVSHCTSTQFFFFLYTVPAAPMYLCVFFFRNLYTQNQRHIALFSRKSLKKWPFWAFLVVF